MGSSAAFGGAGLGRLLADFKPADDIVRRVAGLPRRLLGRTQREVSIIGFPGLSLMRLDQTAANRAAREAFEGGVNYFDNAPAYGKDGECEIKMGPALKALVRDQLSSKP